MATLLSLPAEIRHQILEEAIVIRQPRPASPAHCRGRTPFHNDIELNEWPQETNIYIDGNPRAKTATQSLLHTSRRLRAETQYVLARLASEPYQLDVMFVMGCGLIPTWTNLPGARPEIPRIEINVRIFDIPGQEDDVDPTWLKRAEFRSISLCPSNSDDRDYEPDKTSWNLMVLFTAYLLDHFRDPREDLGPEGVSHGVGRPAGYCLIHKVFVTVTAAEVTTLDRIATATVLLDMFGSSTYLDFVDEWQEGETRGGPTEGILADEARVICAYGLADHIHTLGIRMTSQANAFALYGRFLLANLNVFDVGDDGFPYILPEIEVRFHLLYQYFTEMKFIKEYGSKPSKWIHLVVDERRRKGTWEDLVLPRYFW